MSATDRQHARANILPQATARGSLSSPIVPSEMTPSDIQRLVVYSAEWGPLVSGCGGAALACAQMRGGGERSILHGFAGRSRDL